MHAFVLQTSTLIAAAYTAVATSTLPVAKLEAALGMLQPLWRNHFQVHHTLT